MRLSSLHLLGHSIRIAQTALESGVLENRVLTCQAIGFANDLGTLHDGMRGREANIGALFDAQPFVCEDGIPKVGRRTVEERA